MEILAKRDLYTSPQMLVPEAVMVKLAKPRRSRSRAEVQLAEIVTFHLICALLNKKLDLFYEILMNQINSEPVMCALSLQQRHVAVDKCLRNWLIAVESAVNYWQHSDLPAVNRKRKKANRFLFLAEQKQYVLSLQEISRLRTFLYRELELPMQEQKHKPDYEGPAPSPRK